MRVEENQQQLLQCRMVIDTQFINISRYLFDFDLRNIFEQLRRRDFSRCSRVALRYNGMNVNGHVCFEG